MAQSQKQNFGLIDLLSLAKGFTPKQKTNDEQFYPNLLALAEQHACSICNQLATNYLVLNKKIVCDDCYKDEKEPIEINDLDPLDKGEIA